MRILFLTQILPYPLDAGPKIRAYYVLRYLAQHHEVTLVSFVRPSDSEASIAHLRQFCQAVHTQVMPRTKLLDAYHLTKSFITNQPFIIARDWVKGMANLLDNVMKQAISEQAPFDAVHADQLWMAPYALWAKKAVNQALAPKVVLDQHNAVYLIPQRLAASEPNLLKRNMLALESRKLARYEVESCQKFDDVVWLTSEDYEAVQRWEPAKDEGQDKGRDLDGGVPNSGLIPICSDPQMTPMVERRLDAHRVTFLGGLHWPPNADGVLWFARHVWPQVVKAVPNAVFTIICKDPPDEIKTLVASLSNVDITGYVSDEALPTYLAETAAFVVPLHAGGGMRVKILDAWTWGLPIVSTTVGAEGIRYNTQKPVTQNGQSNEPIEIAPDIIIADEPDAFASEIQRLLINPDVATQLGLAGRQALEDHYDWRKIYTSWDAVYDRNS